MRKTLIVVLLAIFALAMMLPALAVADEPEPPEGATCVDLIAGQDMDVGDVCVWNDADTLYVKYVITDADWCITETHVHVGLDLADFPRAGKQQNPVPGQFDYSACHDCVTEYTYEIPLDDWNEGDDLKIAAHAVVSDAPKGQANGIVYGTRISNGTKGLYEIDVVQGTITLLKEFTPGILSNGTEYSNALAFDPASEFLYFTAPSAVNVVPSPFWYYDLNSGVLGRPCVEDLAGSVVGASWYDGKYYYIAERTNDLMVFDPDSCEVTVAAADFGGVPNDFTFGDFVITSGGMLYGSTRISPLQFFSLDLGSGVYEVFAGADALDLQLAYGSNGKLYGVNHGNGNFYEVDVATGMKTQLPLVAKGFADLASGELFVPKTETAWADGTRFTEQGNWATYFEYEVQPVPCITEEGFLTITGTGWKAVSAWCPCGYTYDFTAMSEQVALQGWVDISEAATANEGDWSKYYAMFSLNDSNGKWVKVVFNNDWLGPWYEMPAQPWDRIRMENNIGLSQPLQYYATIGGVLGYDMDGKWVGAGNGAQVYPSDQNYYFQLIADPDAKTFTLRVYGMGSSAPAVPPAAWPKQNMYDEKMWLEIGTINVGDGFDFTEVTPCAQLWASTQAGGSEASTVSWEGMQIGAPQNP